MGNEGPLLTYFVTGVLLSVLPLGLITAIAVWFYRPTAPRPARAARPAAEPGAPEAAGLSPDGMNAGPPARLARLWRRERATPLIYEGATPWSRHR